MESPQKKAVGYPRVSGEGQGADGYSLGSQIAAIEEYCKLNNIQLVAHFREVESAATVSNRPVFKAAMQYVYRNDVDLIVCVNLDRVFRNVLDAELIRTAMLKRGKKIISTQQMYLTPLQGHDDFELDAAVQHAHVDNEKERKKIKRRFTDGRNRKVAQGGWVGHRPPYEYDVVQGELVLNQERWRVLKTIYRLRQWAGLNARQIRDWLAGNNKMRNCDGTIGRYFAPPCQRQRLRKRIGAYKHALSDHWAIVTIHKVCRDIKHGQRLKKAA